MKCDDIAKVMEKFPSLGRNGFGVYSYKPMTAEEKRQKKVEDREDLLRSADECTLAETWLLKQNFLHRKTINQKSYSYGLKHSAERDMGSYISNGALIAAAVHLGFECEVEFCSPNACFNMGRAER